MPLVTDSQVKAVIDTTRDTTPFIATADLVVSEQLSGKGLSDARLAQIELYLAAHYVAITEEKGGLRRERMGESDNMYFDSSNQKTATSLASTRFGAEAIALDTSGTLRELGRTVLDALFRTVGNKCT